MTTIRQKVEKVLFETIPLSEEISYELFVGEDIEITIYTKSGSHHLPVRVRWFEYVKEMPSASAKPKSSDEIVAHLRQIVDGALFDRIVLLNQEEGV